MLVTQSVSFVGKVLLHPGIQGLLSQKTLVLIESFQCFCCALQFLLVGYRNIFFKGNRLMDDHSGGRLGVTPLPSLSLPRPGLNPAPPLPIRSNMASISDF